MAEPADSDNNSIKEKERLFGWRGYVLSGILVFCGVLIEYNTLCTGFWARSLSALFIEMGIAMFIVVIIGLTLDKWQKESFRNEVDKFRGEADKFIKAFKDNSFLALYNWVVPSKYFLDEIVAQIFSKDTVREDFHVHYIVKREVPTEFKDEYELFKSKYENKMKKPFNCNKRAFVELRVSYKIVNVKSTGIVFTPTWYLEKEDAPEFNCAYYYSRTTANGDTVQLRADGTKDNDINNYLELWNSVDPYNRYKFPEVEIPTGGFIKLEMRSHLIRSIEHTREVYSTIMLTKDMKVTVVDGTDCRLDIHCRVLSPNNFREPRLIEESKEYIWSIDRPLLPYQGVMVWWNDYNKCGETSSNSAPLQMNANCTTEPQSKESTP